MQQGAYLKRYAVVGLDAIVEGPRLRDWAIEWI